ncbi:hypothetical protein DENSPDRAFT_886102 [Dentipellis sp. KUC8613]|nr:hypothetical protein DENSPDRAFT_886102 [Dentipellis sp. KUC8613]
MPAMDPALRRIPFLFMRHIAFGRHAIELGGWCGRTAEPCPSVVMDSVARDEAVSDEEEPTTGGSFSRRKMQRNRMRWHGCYWRCCVVSCVPVAELDGPLKEHALAHLVYHESPAYLLPGRTHSGGMASGYECPPEAYFVSVHAAFSGVLGFSDATPEHGANVDGTGRWVPAVELDAEAQDAGCAGWAGNAEKKLGVVLGGYVARLAELATRVTAVFGQLQRRAIDLESLTEAEASNEAALGDEMEE